MAQVPNKVYPMRSFGEIINDKITTGEFSSTGHVSGSRISISTTNGTIPSGSMGLNEIVILTGASGTSATLYATIKSGSTVAVYSIDFTYVSPQA